MRAFTLPVVLTVVMSLSACGASAQVVNSGAHQSRPPLAHPDCGPAAPEVLAQAAGLVATRIYAGELAGSETRSDQRQIESYTPLLQAIAAGNAGAIREAVTALVYSHTHVVRLRVSKGSTVLADVGGPYILAPLSGPLRLHGQTIAHYVLSVQDDLGYVKLVTRFLGVPLVLRAGSRQVPVEGQLAPAPANIPEHGSLTYRLAHYQAFSFNARAFPSGPLRISLLVPVPASLSARPCAAIKSAELGRAAQLISRRFSLAPANFSTYIKLVRTLTGGLLYIRARSHRLAGAPGPGPRSLPASGSISYRGRSYEIFSFSAPSSLGPVRIYQLTAP